MFNFLNKFGNISLSSQREPNEALLDSPSTSARISATVPSTAGSSKEPSTIVLYTKEGEIVSALLPQSATAAATAVAAAPQPATAYAITATTSPPPPLPLLPPPAAFQQQYNEEVNNTSTMPARASSTTQTDTNITTTTTEAMNGGLVENPISELNKKMSDEFNIYELPAAPTDNLNNRKNLLLLNTITNSGTTNTPFSSKTDIEYATHSTHFGYNVSLKPTSTPEPDANITTAQIINGFEHGFSAALNKKTPHDLDIYDLPNVSRDALNAREHHLLNTSLDTATTATPSSPKSNADDAAYSKKFYARNQNSNHHHHHQQEDINSIESVSENNTILKPMKPDLGWIDELYRDRNKDDSDSDRELSKRRKKKRLATAKELNQLDGVQGKQTANNEASSEEDEQVVKCLYYTLMCCDCSIS